MTHHPVRLISAACALASASCGFAAGGGPMHGKPPRPTDDFGHEFVRVGRPGNRAALPEERYYNQRFPDLGAVGYRYRVSKTEVTAGQWIDFVNAYWSHWEANGGARGDNGFASEWINQTNSVPGQNPGYVVSPGAQNRAVQVEWEVAARYANWLHNSKVNAEWAFETGAYDTSTFAPHPDGGYTHQAERSPGSRFWLPSVDEWVKAAHYDPDRYGEGLEGYWLQKGGQQTPLTPGVAGSGGQTSAGEFLPGFQERLIPVGSYPQVAGPWGVLDTSGGAVEWMETIQFFSADGLRHDGKHYALGSFAGSSDYEFDDYVDAYETGSPFLSLRGIRLASMIPAPSAALLLLAPRLAARRRRAIS